MAKADVKDRILAAATEVARGDGAGHLSLEAVAAKAGVSKGGLLYHFPTKAALMRAMVASFIKEFRAKLDAAASEGDLLSAYVQLSAEDCAMPKPGGAGVLAAMVEDPDFLTPIKIFKREILDRLLEAAPCPERALITFLAIEGMRSLHVFGFDTLTREETDKMTGALIGLSPDASTFPARADITKPS